MFWGQHTQTNERTGIFHEPYRAMQDAFDMGWEDCEWVLFDGGTAPAEYPCVYMFHYGEEHYTCELTSNRPDSYCEVHSA